MSLYSLFKRSLLLAVAVVTLIFIIRPYLAQVEEKVVNVYCFYGMIPPGVVRQFEQETGIRVRFDIYDNNEILEAKLLATNSGYDVVLPTAPPYVGRQISIGVYQPLNKKLLPNLGALQPVIVEKMQGSDPGLIYTIPYYWGTVGIAFNYPKVKSVLPDVDLKSHDLLFNPENLKRLAPYGVSFFEEAIDVFPLILLYLGKDPNSDSLEDLQVAYQHLKKLRPYLRRFTSSRFINDLVMGDVCLTQAWSGEAYQAVQEAKEVGIDIRYVTPKEGAGLWIDCFAIPKGAMHPGNAHAFINFLLRPDIAARITNETYLPTTVLASLAFVEPSLLDNPAVYPPAEMMPKLGLYQLPPHNSTALYERERNRLWAKIRLAQF